jgi:hypothetical protein
MRYSYILEKHINERGLKRPVLFVGESGVRKILST